MPPTSATATHVALLRGVNVGGVRIAMPVLRAAVASLGHDDVATYVQSGNVTFRARGRAGAADLADQVRGAVREHAGIDPGVVVLTADSWDRLVADNPYPEESDGTRLHVAVAQQPFTAAQRRAAHAVRDAVRAEGSDDDLEVVGRVVYLHLPGGMGRSALAAKLGRSRDAAQQQATSRNWRTVLALHDRLRS